MICQGGGNCQQGKRECLTPTACGAEVVGGTYWPLLAESKPHQVEYAGDEPMSDFAVACWWAAGAFAAFIVAAGFVDWLMSF